MTSPSERLVALEAEVLELRAENQDLRERSAQLARANSHAAELMVQLEQTREELRGRLIGEIMTLEGALADARQGRVHVPLNPERTPPLLGPAPPILIVNDDPLHLQRARVVFEACGCEVHTTSSPILVLVHVNRVQPELILLALDMPELPGPSVVRTLDTHGYREGRRVILYADRPQEELEAIAESCRADGAISLRLDPDEQCARLRAFRALKV